MAHAALTPTHAGILHDLHDLHAYGPQSLPTTPSATLKALLAKGYVTTEVVPDPDGPKPTIIYTLTTRGRDALWYGEHVADAKLPKDEAR